jgi:hypothetical protein
MGSKFFQPEKLPGDKVERAVTMMGKKGSRLSFSEPANWVGRVRRKHILRATSLIMIFKEERK